MTAASVGDDAGERYAEWREAYALVDDAYCEWLGASADERPEAFEAYRAALEHEESVAMVYRAVVDRLRQSLPGPAGGERSPREGGRRPRGEGVRILIADGDGFARRMLHDVLQESGEIATVTGARDGREAWALVRREPPDVLLVDIGVPPAGGIELTRKAVAVVPQVRIVTVSVGAEWDPAVLAALRAGAVGHIDKDTAPDQIARLVVLAADGEAILPRRLMTRVLASWRMRPLAADDRGAAA